MPSLVKKIKPVIFLYLFFAIPFFPFMMFGAFHKEVEYKKEPFTGKDQQVFLQRNFLGIQKISLDFSCDEREGILATTRFGEFQERKYNVTQNFETRGQKVCQDFFYDSLLTGLEIRTFCKGNFELFVTEESFVWPYWKFLYIPLIFSIPFYAIIIFVCYSHIREKLIENEEEKVQLPVL